MRGIALFLVISLAVLIFGAQFILHPQVSHAEHGQASQPVADCVSVCLSAIPDTTVQAAAAVFLLLGLFLVFISSVRVTIPHRVLVRSRAPVPLGRYVGTILLRE